MTTQTSSNWISLARDAVSLKPEPFVQMAFHKTALRQALALVVVVGLLIGLVGALVGLGDLVRAPSFDADKLMSEFEQSFSFPEAFQSDPQAQEFLRIYEESVRAFIPSISEMMNLKTPLPPFFGRLLTWLGKWLSAPLGLLGKWLGISIWIMLFARLLGGRGSLLSYLRASSLSTIPHLLAAFNFIPFLGGLLALVAGIWGLAIQYRAVQVTHELSSGRAWAAVLLPYFLALALVSVLITVFIIFVFALASSAG